MKITEDILVILSNLSINGRFVVIGEQLERPIYTKVNAVLVALGGEWSRRAKAHVFATDAQPIIDAAIVLGEVTTAQDIGFFPTPAPLAKELVALAGVEPGDRCLEPSAGTGRIVDALLEAGGLVTICERDPKMHLDLFMSKRPLTSFGSVDFMDMSTDHHPKHTLFRRVVMNPPFCKVGKGDHLDHIQHAFKMLRPDGALVSVVPAGVEFRTDKRYVEFRRWVLGHEGTIERLPPFSFRESGTDVSTCVIRMVRG